MALTDLPALNAMLNATSFMLLMSGYYFIKNGNRQAHQKCMIAAVAVSALFLISYLVYHFNVGSVKFTKQGPIRTIYFAILLTHTVLATAIVPMVIISVVRAWREAFEKHVKIARWTLPIWAYVSITGVVIYLMLYQM